MSFNLTIVIKQKAKPGAMLYVADYSKYSEIFKYLYDKLNHDYLYEKENPEAVVPLEMPVTVLREALQEANDEYDKFLQAYIDHSRLQFKQITTTKGLFLVSCAKDDMFADEKEAKKVEKKFRLTVPADESILTQNLNEFSETTVKEYINEALHELAQIIGTLSSLIELCDNLGMTEGQPYYLGYIEG